MKILFDEIIKMMEQGRDLVLVSVIAGSGSTPRGAGARMIVRSDGTSMGTIGGGAVEYKAGQMAMEVLKDKSSFSKGFRLAKGQAADLGMICGGDVVIYFQYINAERHDFYELCQVACDTCNQEEDSWLITDITDETAWAMGLYSRSRGLMGMENREFSGVDVSEMAPLCQRKPVQVTVGGKRYYSEPLVSAGRVYIFGGGHVAQKLVPVLTNVGFRCVVMDDRPEFASPALFPEAVDTIIGDFDRATDYIDLKEQDYAVIMTRGHQCDYVLQYQVLKTKVSYIGVMGSRKKARTQAEMLREDGFNEADIARIHTPIGMEIAAETPEEIAISVAGELIWERSRRKE